MYKTEEESVIRKAVLVRERKLHGAYDPIRLTKLPAFKQKKQDRYRRTQSRPSQESLVKRDGSGDATNRNTERLETRDDVNGDVPISSSDALSPALPDLSQNTPTGSGSANSKFSNANGGQDTINHDYTTIPSDPSSFVVSSSSSSGLAAGGNFPGATDSQIAGAAAQPPTPESKTKDATSKSSTLPGVLAGCFMGTGLLIIAALIAWKYWSKCVSIRARRMMRKTRSTSQKLESLKETRRESVGTLTPGFTSHPIHRQISQDQAAWSDYDGQGRHQCSKYIPYQEDSLHLDTVDGPRKTTPDAIKHPEGYRPDDSYLDHARMSVLDMSLGTLRSSHSVSKMSQVASLPESSWSALSSSRQLDGLALICQSPNYSDAQVNHRKSKRHLVPINRPKTSPVRMASGGSIDLCQPYISAEVSTTQKLLTSSSFDRSLKQETVLLSIRSMGRTSEPRSLQISLQGSSLLIREKSYGTSLRRPLSSAGASLATAFGRRLKTSGDSSGMSESEASENFRNVIRIDTNDMIDRAGQNDREGPTNAPPYEPALLPVPHYKKPSPFARRMVRRYPSLPDLHALDEAGDLGVETNTVEVDEPRPYAHELGRTRSHLGSCFSGNSTRDSKVTMTPDAASPCASFTFEIKEIKKNVVGSNVHPEDLPRNVSLDLRTKAQMDPQRPDAERFQRLVTEEGGPGEPSHLRHCVSLSRNAPELCSPARHEEMAPTSSKGQGQRIRYGSAPAGGALVGKNDVFVQNLDWDLGSCASSGTH